MSAINAPAPLAIATRGSLSESIHYGHVAIIDGQGTLLASAGDPETVSFLRSSAKPFQALPLLTSGAAERFGFGDEEIAIACGSHNGERVHTETVGRMLEKIHLPESALQCGLRDPLSPSVRKRLRAEGVKPSLLHNNCSGKHAGMLALALHLGVAIGGYLEPTHPVQKLIQETIAQFADVDPESIPVGVDGCGVPTYGLSLREMALAFVRLVQPPESFDAGTRAACKRITDSMRRYPVMIAGDDGRTLDTLLMRVTPGLISKEGAEGVYTAAVIPSERYPHGLGIALKVSDGDGRDRVRPPVAVALLQQLGIIREEQLGGLESLRQLPIKSNHGEVVGRMEPVIALTWADN